jgi:bifunctional non-homologous end joining protein LigD
MKKGMQWLLTKSRDKYASDHDLVEMPGSVLTGKTNDQIESKHQAARPEGVPADFPLSVRPMLATPVDEPFDNKDWVFEIKWDGVRSVIFRNKSKGILEIHSRSGRDITHRYPEIAGAIDSAVKCNNSVVLDGEIVVLNELGVPDFQRHQRRMNVDYARDIESLSREAPATCFVFDVLYLDGQNLEKLSFIERRSILDKVIGNSARIRISDFIEEKGKSVFQSAIEMKLEGVVAKYKNSRYVQGTRSSCWLKIKGILTQDCVVIGYTRGEGNREGYFGSLILAAYHQGRLKFVGHSGSGFGFDQLEHTMRKMQELRIGECPIDHVPYTNREPAWLRPEMVAEIKFSGWTQEKIMRAPIFLRFRDDKMPQECLIEAPKETKEIVGSTQDTLNFSNPDKTFWPATQEHRELKKKDLIEYYDRISGHILPHMQNRPLSLSRYPDGALGKSFYHKNWDQAKPEYAKTVKVFSEFRSSAINYLICNNRETLLWLANLGCIEMHPWYSRVHDFAACTNIADSPQASDAALDEDRCGLGTPDFIIFDLDPYIYSGKEQGQEPEYNVAGFKAAVEVAYDLKQLLDELKIKSYVKTSGKTGLHVFVPVAPIYTYEQTRAFAEITGRILGRRSPGKITMEWSTSKRKGKVFFDHNQNARGKTIASIFSARPTRSATVSMPVKWNELADILPTQFTILNVPDVARKSGDPWKGILQVKQDIGRLLENISELA